jgi:hypothetical protein
VSIDPYVVLTHPIALRPLLPKAGAVLAEMLGLEAIPELALHVLENGRHEVAEIDEIRDESCPFFYLITIVGEPECVGLNVPGRHVWLSMGAQRTALNMHWGLQLRLHSLEN